MKHRKTLPILIALSLCTSLILSGCSKTGTQTTASQTTAATPSDVTPEVVDYATTEAESSETVTASDAEDLKTDFSGAFSVTTSVDGGYTVDGAVYTFTKAGTYTLSGSLEEGQLIVDADDDDEVELVFNSASVTCSSGAVLFVENADKVILTAVEGTYNELLDTRTSIEETDSDDGATAETAAAAVYSTADLNIEGVGALYINSASGNGVHGKDDITIENLTLKVDASGYGIKGNDSVTVKSGEILVIARTGDGIKTVSSDVTDKGNQKGTLTIKSGTVTVYAAGDALSAAYDVDIEDGTVSLFTDTYADYTEEASGVSSTDFYLILSSDDYSEGYDWYGYYYNADEDTGVFAEASYYTEVRSGSTQYYGLLLQAPDGYENVAFYAFSSGSEPSVDSYVATTDGEAVNSSMNAYLLSLDGDGLSGEWVTLTLSSPSGNGGSSSSLGSTKGIKAENTVVINGGTITIESTDDGIHANAGTTLDNGDEGAGEITVNGGSVTVTSGDDGFHADTTLSINSGTVNIIQSYEGLEANQITINGGSIYVYATDDGLNGSTSYVSTSALVTVNGGYLDVETASGDTDGIDVNGSYVQNGGFVIVRGGASAGSVCGSVDVDGTITVTGGAIVALGGICETPSGDSVNAYVSSGTTVSAGTYILSGSDGTQVLTFDLDSSYTNIWIASDTLETGSAYTLTCDGSEILSWTQEEGTMGSTGGFGNMGGGMGNMGGGMGGRGGGMGGH